MPSVFSSAEVSKEYDSYSSHVYAKRSSAGLRRRDSLSARPLLSLTEKDGRISAKWKVDKGPSSTEPDRKMPG